MVARARPVLGVLAVLALLVLPGLSGAPADRGLPIGGEAVVTVSDAVAATAPRAPRASRPLLLPFVLVAGIALVTAVGAGLTTSPSRDRHRRCLDDVGDDWRSLLLGAPPARV